MNVYKFMGEAPSPPQGAILNFHAHTQGIVNGDGTPVGADLSRPPPQRSLRSAYQYFGLRRIHLIPR